MGWEDDGPTTATARDSTSLTYELAYCETSAPSPSRACISSQPVPLIGAQPFSSVAFVLPFSSSAKTLVVTIRDYEGAATTFSVNESLETELQANITLCSLQQAVAGQLVLAQQVIHYWLITSL